MNSQRRLVFASRVNNLVVHHTGADSRAFLELQDQLAKLELVAIVKDLQSEHADYQKAIQGLNDAIAFIGEATKRIEKVARAIQLVATAAKLAEEAIKTSGLRNSASGLPNIALDRLPPASAPLPLPAAGERQR